VHSLSFFCFDFIYFSIQYNNADISYCIEPINVWNITLTKSNCNLCEVFSCTLPSILQEHVQWQALVLLYKKHCKRSSELTTDVNIWWWLSINYAGFASIHFIPVICGFIISRKIILKWSFSVIKENYIMLANNRKMWFFFKDNLSTCCILGNKNHSWFSWTEHFIYSVSAQHASAQQAIFRLARMEINTQFMIKFKISVSFTDMYYI